MALRTGIGSQPASVTEIIHMQQTDRQHTSTSLSRPFEEVEVKEGE